MSKDEGKTEEITVEPVTANERNPNITSTESKKKKKSTGKLIANFLYDPKRKTIFGRDSLNWGK